MSSPDGALSEKTSQHPSSDYASDSATERETDTSADCETTSQHQSSGVSSSAANKLKIDSSKDYEMARQHSNFCVYNHSTGEPKRDNLEKSHAALCLQRASSSDSPSQLDNKHKINNTENLQATLLSDEESNSGITPTQLRSCKSLVNSEGHPRASVSSNSANKQLNSLKNSLKRFFMSELLEALEKSLEDVRKRKRDKKDHEQLLRDNIKELLKKSKIFHPDKTINRGESPDVVEHAQNVQSALNATITILRTLTEIFLEDTDIDFKYQYFADLEINVLASDYEIKLQIGNVLCKIRELSEIKRISIIGQIRKFLLQSQDGFTSFIDGNKEKFMRHIGGAFYHLKKCIAGYESLNSEYKLLEKECKDEGDENMRSVIQKLAEESCKESEQLERLESAKEKSRYNFQIFSVEKNMDEYFILPFVHHVNALLMCHVMLGRSSSHRYSFLSYSILCMNANQDKDLEPFSSNPDFENFPECYTEPYQLLRHYKKDCPSVEREDIKEKFKEAFKGIVKFLQKEFKTEAYFEGKSNKAKIAEEFLKLKNEVENFNA